MLSAIIFQEVFSQPVLTGFRYEHSYGYIQLTFDGVVAARSLDLSKIFLMSESNISPYSSQPSEYFAFDGIYNNMELQGNTTKPYFFLRSDDYARMKVDSAFGSELSKTFIAIQTGAFQTWEKVDCSNYTIGMQANEYFPDTLPPYVIDWSLDMNTGYISISFSEPISGIGDSGLQFTMNGLAIQSVSHIEYTVGNPKYVGLVENDETTLVSESSYSRKITVNMGNTNLNRIKVGSVIGRTKSTSWLSILTPICNDTDGNPLALAGVDFYDAVAVTSFTPDTNKPYLIKWDYDVYPGRLALYFSEVIAVSSFNFSAVALSSHAGYDDDRIVTRLNVDTDIRERQTDDSDVYYIRLSQSSYDETLEETGYLTSDTNSYLIVEDGVAWDTSPQQNRFYDAATTLESAKAISSLIPDTVSPFITSAALDMTNQTITLGFHKNVRASSVDLQEIVIQSERGGGDASEVLSLSDTVAETVIPTKDSPYVTLQLNSLAFNYMKESSNLGLTSSSSYIAFTVDFIKDKAFVANKVEELPTSSAFLVTSFIADYVAPYLVSWYPDMHDDKLILEFSEPVNTALLDVSDIKLYSDEETSLQSTFMVRLSEATVSDVDITTVTLQLTRGEAIQIKTSAPLCTKYTACFLSHSESMVKDTNTYDGGLTVNNSIIPTSVLMSSTDFIPDEKGPKLMSYILDMNDAEVELEFTEPVEVSTADPTGLRFYADNIILGPSEVNISSTSYVSFSQGVFMTISFSNLDFAALKLADIASNGTAYLSVGENTITDVAGNALDGSTEPFDRVIRRDIVQDLTLPSSIITDATPAHLVALYRHSSDQILTLYFDDVLKISSMTLGNFYIYNPLINAEHSLLDAEVTSVNNSAIIDINLENIWSDLVDKGIAQSQTATGIFVSSTNAFVDIPNENPNELILSSNSVLEGQNILYFQFDLSQKLLLISLAFPMDWGTWSPADMQFYSKINHEKFSLTDLETYELLDNDMTLVINIHHTTMSDLTTTMSVIDKTKITLLVAESAFVDSSGKHLSTDIEIPCKQILIDLTPPEVSSYNLDLNDGTIEIFFSKPISTSTVSVKALSLIDSNVEADVVSTISLKDSELSVSRAVQTSILILLNEGDYPTLRDLIHESGTIGSTQSLTRLKIAKGFVADTGDPAQYMQPVSISNSIAVTSLTQDTTPPRIVSWGIDMSHRYVNITFDEAVAHSSNYASYYLLLRDPSDTQSAQRYLLTSSTTNGNGNTIKIQISEEDINAVNIQNKLLCYTGNDCFLSVRANSIKDISYRNNKFAGILFKFAYEVDIYISDVVPPHLVSYEFSLQSGEMWMHFDEMIDCNLIDMTKFQLQYAVFLGISTQYFFLGTSEPDCSYYTGQYTKDIYVPLTHLDKIGIKAISSLYKSISTTFIAKGAGAITDLFGNELIDIIDGYAVQCGEYTADTVRPEIISYTIDSARILIVYFTEPMLASALDTSEIQFQTSLPPYTNSFKLFAATLYQTDQFKMVLKISLGSEYTRISGNSAIFSSQASTFLSISDSAITDTSGNSLIGIPESLAKPLGPSAIAWDLNVDTSVITIEFNEEVNTNFDLSGLSVQSKATLDSDTVSVTLSTTTTVSALNSENTIFQVILGDADLNNLKLNGLVSSKSAAYLVVPFGLTVSTLQSTLVPYLSTVEIPDIQALNIRDLVKDRTAPDITSFGINFNTGELYLRFTEPIETSTFEVAAISIISSSVGSSAALTAADDITLSGTSTIVITMTASDFNNVKIAQASGALDNMILGFQACKDYFGNYYPGNTELNPIEESDSVADSQAPVLVSASLDTTVGQLLLYFDEIVDIAALDQSYITLMSSSDINTADKMTLTKYTNVELTEDGAILFDLKSFKSDWLNLGSIGTIGTEISNTFIQYELVQDLFGNVMASSSVHQADSVILDTSVVKLLGFRLKVENLNYRLEMTFDKAVKINTFACSDFDLLTVDDDVENLVSGSTYIDLVDLDCTMLTVDDYAITIDVHINANKFDLNDAIKWISVGTGTSTKDLYDNALDASSPIKIGTHISKYFIDMNTGVVTFGFTAEVTISSSFDSTKMGFYSAASQSSIYLQSTATSLSPIFTDSPVDDVVARITLDTSDLELLKEIDVSASTLYLIIDESAMSDTFDFSIVPIVADDKKLPMRFTSDDVKPALLNAELDLGSDLIIMDFDEPIRASSVKVTQIRIQFLSNSLSNSMTLTGLSATPTTSLKKLTLKLKKEDVATLTLREHLAKNISSSYLSFASGTAADYAGNKLPAISSSSAYQFDSFIDDAINPVLETFDLDMTAEIITFHFSEAVDATSVSPLSLTLMARAALSDGGYFTLTGGTILDGDGRSIRLQLSSSDVYSLISSLSHAK